LAKLFKAAGGGPSYLLLLKPAADGVGEEAKARFELDIVTVPKLELPYSEKSLFYWQSLSRCDRELRPVSCGLYGVALFNQAELGVKMNE
jgi:hypothetical protein